MTSNLVKTLALLTISAGVLVGCGSMSGGDMKKEEMMKKEER